MNINAHLPANTNTEVIFIKTNTNTDSAVSPQRMAVNES